MSFAHMKGMLLDVIGCGSIIQTTHSKIINTLKSPYLNVLGCYDSNRGASAAFSKLVKCRQYGDIDELFSSAANVVLIGTPPDTHFRLMERALEAGKNILCEKPFVVTQQEGLDLIKLADKKGLEILVGHFRRFFPNTLLARNYVRDNFFRLKEIRAAEGGRFSWHTSSNYVTRSKSGSVIYDTGSHLIDTLLFTLGLDETEVMCEIGEIRKSPEAEPCHEVECKLNLQPPGIPPLPLQIRLSRLRPELNLIKYIFDDHELWLNTTLSTRATLKMGQQFFFLTEKNNRKFVVNNVYDCFSYEYLLMLEALNSDKQKSNPLDARRFVTVSGLLERLSNEKVDSHSLLTA